MDSACKFKAGRSVLEYLRILPVDKHDARLYTMAFSALAAARDLDSATAALDLAKRQGVLVDKHLLTAFMKGAPRPPLPLRMQCGQRLQRSAQPCGAGGSPLHPLHACMMCHASSSYTRARFRISALTLPTHAPLTRVCTIGAAGRSVQVGGQRGPRIPHVP